MWALCDSFSIFPSNIVVDSAKGIVQWIFLVFTLVLYVSLWVVLSSYFTGTRAFAICQGAVCGVQHHRAKRSRGQGPLAHILNFPINISTEGYTYDAVGIYPHIRRPILMFLICISTEGYTCDAVDVYPHIRILNFIICISTEGHTFDAVGIYIHTSVF